MGIAGTSQGTPQVSSSSPTAPGKEDRLAFYRATTRSAAGELAAGVVHDINNPLQVMMLHLELLQTGRPMPNWTSMFTQQIERISELMNRLREFARVTSAEPLLEPMDLHAAVDEALAIVSEDFQRGGIVVACSYAPGGAEIMGCGLLRQALVELLVNASEAITGGGPVRIQASREGAFMTLRLSDSGPGVAPEVRDTLFKPFVTTRGGGRPGLGLAICARVVGQMGGEISLEEGPGASFLLKFPALQK